MMMDTTRRDFLAGSGVIASAALAGMPQAAFAQSPKPPLTSDIGQLDRVLVHSAQATDGITSQTGRRLIPGVDYDGVAAEAQHRALNALLRQSGAEIVELRDALTSAREATLGNGIWEAWIDASFPRLGAAPQDVTADMVLGRDPAWQWRLDAGGDFTHFADGTGSTMWTRDSGFMTPAGHVICNSSSPTRGRENMLLRFLFRYSPMLADVPIAFDAVEEGLIVEGGDAMVVDRNTMFLGVGSRTSPTVAPALARKLGMDVITVQITPPEFVRESWPGEERSGSELALLFLHLDTSFTLVGPKHALALPYIFEIEHAEDNPLARYIRGAVKQSLMSKEDAEKGLELLKGIGTLTRYAAGSGRAEKIEGMKLVDFCRSEGYRITNTGGPIPDGDEAAFAHFMRTTYGEQRRQASNVVQATPGRVIAYEGNPATQAALEADGIAVDTFAGRELWNWHGGPHCLTQPLARS